MTTQEESQILMYKCRIKILEKALLDCYNDFKVYDNNTFVHLLLSKMKKKLEALKIKKGENEVEE